MNKNDLFELTITDMGTDGEGIGHYDGMTFFVKDALIGDVITARALKLKKNYGYARVEEIKSPSTFRVEAECPLHRYRRFPMRSSLNLRTKRCGTIS